MRLSHIHYDYYILKKIFKLNFNENESAVCTKNDNK